MLHLVVLFVRLRYQKEVHHVVVTTIQALDRTSGLDVAGVVAVIVVDFLSCLFRIEAGVLAGLCNAAGLHS
jgi:hypothetical protein